MPDEPVQVAVACQGGGSHTAFTAGVLRRLLENDQRDYEIIAFTGTSGGALCALIAWYCLHTGDAETARAALSELWEDLAAQDVYDSLLNSSVVNLIRSRQSGHPVFKLSPALNPLTTVATRRIRDAIEAQVDPKTLEDLVADPDENPPPPPKLLISAVDAMDGSFEVFTDRPGEGSAATDGFGSQIEQRPRALSMDAVFASAAVPDLFEPVRFEDPSDESVHEHWDGLLSQNPPIRNLVRGDRAARKPDEIWVVRINPKARQGGFSALEEINDRRNELVGNLSLHQELYFICKVNQWLEEDVFSEKAREKYKPVIIREIELDEHRLDRDRGLLGASKLDRRPGFIRDLIDLGERQAEEFLDARDHDENRLYCPEI